MARGIEEQGLWIVGWGLGMGLVDKRLGLDGWVFDCWLLVSGKRIGGRWEGVCLSRIHSFYALLGQEWERVEVWSGLGSAGDVLGKTCGPGGVASAYVVDDRLNQQR